MKLDALIEPWQNGREGRITEKQLYHFEKYNQNPNLIQNRLDGSRAAIVGLGASERSFFKTFWRRACSILFSLISMPYQYIT